MARRIESGAVIGTGSMGPGVALTLALSGLPVTIVSRTAEGEARGLHKARALAAFLRDNELVTQADAAEALERLTTSSDLDAAARGADFILESGPEDLAWKQELFAALDHGTGSGAILASNTS